MTNMVNKLKQGNKPYLELSKKQIGAWKRHIRQGQRHKDVR